MDDVAVLSDSLDLLKSALEKLSSTAFRVGLLNNWMEAKIMPIDKTSSVPSLTVELKGQAVDLIRQLKFLGSIIFSNGLLDVKISARSTKLNSVFGRLLRGVFLKP